jgi:hypothetical protein
MAEDFLYLVKPTVNLNGTVRKELLEQYMVTLTAVYQAQLVLSRMAPHGRDYPVTTIQAGGGFDEAVKQHRRRWLALDLVRKEVEYLAEKL